nr:BREX system Lon protease-like protein BrxL [Tranquillimonas alkanivorans]
MNNTSGKIGLVGYWDTVAFDEFAGKAKKVDTRRHHEELPGEQVLLARDRDAWGGGIGGLHLSPRRRPSPIWCAIWRMDPRRRARTVRPVR